MVGPTNDGGLFSKVLEKIRNGVADLELLYDSVGKTDSKKLKKLQEMPLAGTPLHLAASSSRKLGLHFVIELATLMPTLMKKMDQKGQTPLHLALQKGNLETARALVDIDSSLIRVKGKYGKTPLHVAVEMGQTKLAAEFLSECPASIEDLTSRRETVLHLVVSKGHVDTLHVLMQWLRNAGKDAKNILNSKNSEGDTALHIAVHENKAEMVRELLKYVDLDAKNSMGKTAQEICGEDKNEIKKMIEDYKQEQKWSHWIYKWIKKLCMFLLQRDIFSEHSIGAVLFNWGRELDEKSRDITLLVAVLIATAAYQGILSPPGGFWQDSSSSNNKTSHTAGHMIMNGTTRTCYLLFNSISFLMSIAVIIACMPGHVASAILIFSVTFLLMTYFTAFINASPWKSSTGSFRVKKSKNFQKKRIHMSDPKSEGSAEVQRSDHSAADPQTHMMSSVIVDLKNAEYEP